MAASLIRCCTRTGKISSCLGTTRLEANACNKLQVEEERGRGWRAKETEEERKEGGEGKMVCGRRKRTR
jgi:hypothetical protein